MQLRYQKAMLTSIVGLGLLAALYVAGRRTAVERANRTVEIGVEWRECDQLALLSGQPMPELLARLRAAGATTLVIFEDTLGSLQQDGYISLKPRRIGPPGDQRMATYVDMEAPGGAPLSKRIGDNLRARTNMLVTAQAVVPMPKGRASEARGATKRIVPARASDILEYGMGLDAGKLRDAADAGLRVAVRPTAKGIATREGIAFVLDQMRTAAPSSDRAVIFAGNTVLGYPDHVCDTAESFEASSEESERLYYGSVEFGKQFGDAALSRALDGRVVRVHGINAAEMQGMAVPTAVERFVRAVKERNIRFCYVRLFLTSSSDPLQKNERYLRALASRLRAAGFEPGGARPFGPFEAPLVALCVVALGAVAGALLLLCTIAPISWRTLLILLAAGAAACVLSMWAAPGLARKLWALLAALTFPVLAVASFPPKPDESRPPGRALLGTLRCYALCSLVSLVGAALVVGLLSSVPFMTKADQFGGVKLALFAPILLVGIIHLGRLFGAAENASEQWQLAAANWREALAHVVKYSHVIIILVAVVAAAIVLLRSGNEPGFGLSGVEMRARDVLEQTLGARPRQKEFLVGHPLLLLSFFLLLRGRRRGLWALFAAATLGQTSMVNTFCHIHTPLTVSVLRTFNGLWLGALLGIVIIFVYWLGWGRHALSAGPDIGDRPAE